MQVELPITLSLGRQPVVWLLAVAAAILPAGPVTAQQPEPRFCVVDVENGKPTDADAGDAWRMVIGGQAIPGIPGLVFVPTNRRGQWTVGADRTYKPYTEPFPQNYLDLNNWVLEPWSGRLVASNSRPGASGVWVLEPGASHLVPVSDVDGTPVGGAGRPTLLPEQQATVVVRQGVPYVVDGMRLKPWLPPAQLEPLGEDWIIELYWLENAKVVIAQGRDDHVRALVDGAWQDLGSAGRISKVWPLGDVADTASAQGGLRLFVRTAGGIEMTQVSSGDGETEELFGLGEYLRHTGEGWFDGDPRWQALRPEGWVDVPGGGLERATGWVLDVISLPSAEQAIIAAPNALYLYDGDGMTPIAGSSPELIGKLSVARTLRSIGADIVVSERGVFLLDQGSLRKLDTPFSVDLESRPEFIDWPAAGVALVTADGVFTLDRDLRFTKISEVVAQPVSGPSDDEVPSTGDLLLLGSDRLLLAVDSLRGEDGVCDRPSSR